MKSAQKESRVPWVHGTPLEEREIKIMYEETPFVVLVSGF
jgi:hypothetical protein